MVLISNFIFFKDVRTLSEFVKIINLCLLKFNVYSTAFKSAILSAVNIEAFLFILKGFPIRVICFEIEKKH